MSFSFLFGKSIISAFFRGIGVVSSFIFSLLLAREFGPHLSGLFFLAFSIVSILSAFSKFGLDNSLIRFVGSNAPERNWGEVRGVVNKALTVTAFLSIIVAITLFFLSEELAQVFFSKFELGGLIESMSWYIVFFSLSSLLAMGLQGLNRTISSVFVLNISTYVSICIVLFFIDSLSIHAVSNFFVGSGALTFCVALLLWFWKLPNSSGNISWKELFNSCLPLWVFMMMGQLIQWSGQLSLGVWGTPADIGLFAIAQRISMLVIFLLMAVNVAIAPKFASLYREQKWEDLERLAKMSSRLILIAATPLLVLILLFPELILQIFGDEFVGAKPYLQILVVGQFVNAATGSVGFLLSMSGNEKYLRNTSILSGLAIVILCLILVPSYGAHGAAIATTFSVAFQNLLAVYFVRQKLGFNALNVFIMPKACKRN